jgi:hypothetical protein
MARLYGVYNIKYETDSWCNLIQEIIDWVTINWKQASKEIDKK